MSFNLYDDKDCVMNPKEVEENANIGHVLFTPTQKRIFKNPVFRVPGHYLKRFLVLYYRFKGNGKIAKFEYKFFLAHAIDTDHALQYFERDMFIKHWKYKIISINLISSWIEEEQIAPGFSDILNSEEKTDE